MILRKISCFILALLLCFSCFSVFAEEETEPVAKYWLCLACSSAASGNACPCCGTVRGAWTCFSCGSGNLSDVCRSCGMGKEESIDQDHHDADYQAGQQRFPILHGASPFKRGGSQAKTAPIFLDVFIPFPRPPVKKKRERKQAPSGKPTGRAVREPPLRQKASPRGYMPVLAHKNRPSMLARFMSRPHI